jgi:hypothetical protein
MYISFSFSFKSTLVAYATTNHFVVVYETINQFYQVPQRTVASIVEKWWIWTQVSNASVGMDKIPCSEAHRTIALKIILLFLVDNLS